MFKKDDRVWLAGSVSSLSEGQHLHGEWYIRSCIVISCGKKRMHLLDAETGETVGRNFPADSGLVFKADNVGEALEVAKHLAQQTIERDIEYFTQMRDKQTVPFMRKDFNERLQMIKKLKAGSVLYKDAVKHVG